MSVALHERVSVRGALPWAVLGLGVALVVVNLVWMALGHAPKAEGASDTANQAVAPAAAAPGNGPGGLPDKVTLAGEKLKEAGVAAEKVELVSLPAELSVAGRIDANQNRQVQVRPRAAGVVREVKVEIGQDVAKGQVLAVLDSPDVGTARLNLRARQRELGTARFEAGWKKQVAENVAALVPLLGRRAEANEIARQFADRPLGSYRSSLLETYSKYDIAAHEEEKTRGLRRERIVGEHPEYLAIHTREGAQAVFEGTVEQARFDANQQSLMAAQQVRRAEADVIDAAQRLRILGVPENIEKLLDQADDASASVRKLAEEDVTAYEVAAPFAGRVITRTPTAVISQKAEVNDQLFTVADLSTVWVTANIPESDFALLPALNNGAIRVSAAAYPGRTFAARLLSVGATVDPTTRTVPMLAETRNPDGLLKIGMFVRIMLDTAVESKGLTVPEAAVVEIEGTKGVFVPDPKDPHAFAFRAVKTGRQSGDRLEITSGLTRGEAVVTRGAFTLKSELILQNETEED
jgi:RND family efflux transporter MFP subunit